MPSSGVLPSITGESWFGVDSTARPVPSQTSHYQPEPNRLIPASTICCLRKSNAPKVPGPAARAPRLAAAVRRERLPEERVIRLPAAVVADRPLLVGLEDVEVGDH